MPEIIRLNKKKRQNLSDILNPLVCQIFKFYSVQYYVLKKT